MEIKALLLRCGQNFSGWPTSEIPEKIGLILFHVLLILRYAIALMQPQSSGFHN